MENEIWKDINGFPLYAVSNLGRIKSKRREYRRTLPNGTPQIVVWAERIIKGWVKREGGRQVVAKVALRCDGVTHVARISHLVLEAFVGPRPEGMEACHNDGRPANNAIENLRWDTHAANMADQVRHGTKSTPPIHHGEKHHNATISDADVASMRALPKRRGLQAELARKHGVTAVTIGRILDGKSRLRVAD